MKESNQQPLRMNFTALRKYALNTEASVVNPGVLSDDNDDHGGSKPKGKLDKTPRKNHGGSNKNNNKSILEGQ
jgi:hypothetical protein